MYYYEQEAEYVHVDVSDQFSRFGKLIVTVVWIGSAISIWFSSPMGGNNSSSDERQWKMALTGSILMVWTRWMLQMSGMGPKLDISRQVFVDPMIFYLAGSFLQASIRCYFFSSDTESFINRKRHPNWKTYIKTIMVSILSSISITEDAAESLFWEDGDSNADGRKGKGFWIHRVCWKMGSSTAGVLSFTSNFATFVLVVVAYDVITWRDYILNLFAASTLMLVASFIILLIYTECCLPYLLVQGGVDERNRDDVGESTTYSLTRKDDHDEANDLELTVADSLFGDDMASVSTANSGFNERPIESTKDQIDPLHTSKDQPMSMQDDDDEARNSWYVAFGLPFVGLPIAFCICNGESLLLISWTFVAVMIWIGSACYYDSSRDSADYDRGQLWKFIDLKPLILYSSWCILTGSLADTGVPQFVFNISMGKCADQMTEGSCINKFEFLVYAMSTCLSPLVTVIGLLCTFPYASPYDWIQVVVAISMGGYTRCLWNLTPRSRSSHRDMHAEEGSKCIACTRSSIIWRVLVVSVSLLAQRCASAFIQGFHTVYECSERLGECGGWR